MIYNWHRCAPKNGSPDWLTMRNLTLVTEKTSVFLELRSRLPFLPSDPCLAHPGSTRELWLLVSIRSLCPSTLLISPHHLQNGKFYPYCKADNQSWDRQKRQELLFLFSFLYLNKKPNFGPICDANKGCGLSGRPGWWSHVTSVP